MLWCHIFFFLVSEHPLIRNQIFGTLSFTLLMNLLSREHSFLKMDFMHIIFFQMIEFPLHEFLSRGCFLCTLNQEYRNILSILVLNRASIIVIIATIIIIAITIIHYSLCCVSFCIISVPLVSRVCPSDTYKVWKSGESSKNQKSTCICLY